MIPLVILAGGLGTRLNRLAGRRPKALVEVGGGSFLDYQLHWAARQGVRRVVLCIGYRGLQIRRHLEARRPPDLEIRFSDEGSRPRGTATALRRALPLLGARFFVLYGDSYLPVRYAALERAHRRLSLPALMAVYRNAGRYDRSNVAPAGWFVSRYVPGGGPDLAWADAGLSVLTPKALAGGSERGLADLYRRLAAGRRLGCWRTRSRFWEVGSPGGLAEFRRHVRTGSRLRASFTKIRPTALPLVGRAVPAARSPEDRPGCPPGASIRHPDIRVSRQPDPGRMSRRPPSTTLRR